MSINPHGKAIELHVCIDVAKPFSLLNLRSSLDLSSMEDSIRLWIALSPTTDGRAADAPQNPARRIYLQDRFECDPDAPRA